MKKINLILACAAGMAVLASCQKELIEGEQIKGTPVENLVATASIPQVKVSFTQDGTTGNLKGSWEVGDVIFGLKGDSVPVEFSVAEVDATTGVATLTQTTDVAFSNGDEIHVIYCKGKTSTDLKDGTLAIDFSSQSKENLPIVMLADATVSEGAVNFQFTNAVSIIGISKPSIKGDLTDGRGVPTLVLSGNEIVSSATVALEEGKFVLNGDVPSKFISVALDQNDLDATSSDAATFKNPIYVAVPPCTIERATFVDGKRYIRSYLIDKTAAASKFYSIAEKDFTSISLPTAADLKVGNLTWAKINFGATKTSGTSVDAWGSLYMWGAVDLIYSEITASGFTIKSEYNTEAGFDGANHPYYDDVAKKYTKYIEDDGKTVLDPVDDIVQLTYPGSGWCIPTVDDVQAMIDDIAARSLTCSITSGYVTVKDADGKTLSFIRAKNGAKGLAYEDTGKYFTSSVTDITNTNVKCLTLSSKGAISTSSTYRVRGLPIRPVRHAK